MSMDSESDDGRNDLSVPDVTTKYKLAATITNDTLAAVLAEVKPGARVVDLCALGDRLIEEGTGELYKKKKKGSEAVEKGIAFPTCVSVNACAGSFSPMNDDSTTLKEGDIVKVELGTHVDGYQAVAAHTVACGQAEVGGRAADVLQAGNMAAEAAVRLLRPGGKGSEVTAAIRVIADAFGVEPVEGVLSSRIKRFTPDAYKQFPTREIDPGEEKLECGDVEFEEGEAYTVDIRLSTGQGRLKLMKDAPNVYRRNVDDRYQLKSKAARAVFNEVNQRFPTMPFSLRALSDEKNARFGIRQLASHNLVEPYALTQDKDDQALVVMFKFTALLLPSQTLRLSPTAPLPLPKLNTDKKVTDKGVLETMQLGLKRNKKKRNRGKGGGGGAGGSAPMETD